jgi:transposase-like protein
VRNEEQSERDRPKCTNKQVCPYCQSKNVSSLGMGHGLGESGPIKHRYKCLNDNCQKDFYVVE